MDLKKQLERFELRQAELDSEVIAHNGEFKEILSGIKNGGTTGDPITDYVLLNYKSINPSIQDEFRRVNEIFVRHQGSLVLTLETTEHEEGGCEGIVPAPLGFRRRTFMKTTPKLAVISGPPRFKVLEDRVEIPSNGMHLVGHDSYFNPTWETRNEDLSFWGNTLGQAVEIQPPNAVYEDDELDITRFLQDKKPGLELYFGERSFRDQLQTAKGLDRSYFRGLHLLSHPIPEDSKPAHNAYLEREKNRVVSHLEKMEKSPIVNPDEFLRVLEEAREFGLDQDETKIVRGAGLTLNVKALYETMVARYTFADKLEEALKNPKA